VQRGLHQDGALFQRELVTRVDLAFKARVQCRPGDVSLPLACTAPRPAGVCRDLGAQLVSGGFLTGVSLTN
jgi:hypothetical protein